MSVVIDLAGFVMGEGTNYEVAPPGLGGYLGNPPAKTADVPRGHADGDAFGPDFYETRVITIPLTVTGTSPANVLANIESLRDAWAVVDSDITISITLWGVSQLFHGRPRACEIIAEDLASREALADCEFHCTTADPVVS